MPDLTARLLDENFEEALTEAGMLFVLEQSRATNNAWRTAAFEAIRELHRRLATAKADLTAAREDVAALLAALDDKAQGEDDRG